MTIFPSSPQRCGITRLQLSAFRNHAQLELRTTEDPVIITGQNGAGKTNLLEALSFLSPGRGLRKAKLSEIDRQGQAEPWAVAVEAVGLQGVIRIGTGRDPSSPANDKRTVRVEGKTLRGHGELAHYLSVLWLTPQMDQLFLEGGGARRRFLDRLVYSFDAEHAGRVASYEHSVRERNRLLAASHGHSAHETLWLDAIERKIAEKSATIAVARLETAEHLNNAIQMSEGSFPKASMALRGEAETQIGEGHSALETEEHLVRLLAEARARDATTGRTGVGAHVTEITVIHIEKQMEAALCSTGEQKAMLLSLILAQARAGVIWYGVVPILLLDEVIAHLDRRRRHELYNEINGLNAQAWMTGTDAGDFSDWSATGQIFTLTDGQLKPA